MAEIRAETEIGGRWGMSWRCRPPYVPTEPVSPNVKLVVKVLFRAYHTNTLPPPPLKSVATPLAIAQFIHDLPCIAKL